MEMAIRLSTAQVELTYTDLMFVAADSSSSIMTSNVRWEDYNFTPRTQRSAFCVHLWQQSEFWALWKGDPWQQKKAEKAAEDWNQRRATKDQWLQRSGQSMRGGFRAPLRSIEEEPDREPDEEPVTEQVTQPEDSKDTLPEDSKHTQEGKECPTQ